MLTDTARPTPDPRLRAIRLTAIDRELGWYPDPNLVYNAMHPEERRFGYEDRSVLRRD